MRLLLDSHAYLWWLVDDPSLSGTVREAVADPASLVFVSAASIWEISIKTALGRLDAGGADLIAEISENAFSELPITALHADRAGRLPPHHDDPFDRMLIAQAQAESLTCVTRDPAFALYDVNTLW
jgi:PIN domain nuclease of toxin-antitoxin system